MHATPAKTQVLYRNLALVNVWAMVQAMDPTVPDLDTIDEGMQRQWANEMVVAGMRWQSQVEHRGDAA